MWRRRGEFLFQSPFFKGANPQNFPIIANIGNSLNEHGGVRGEARFPPAVPPQVKRIFYKYNIS